MVGLIARGRLPSPWMPRGNLIARKVHVGLEYDGVSLFLWAGRQRGFRSSTKIWVNR